MNVHKNTDSLSKIQIHYTSRTTMKMFGVGILAVLMALAFLTNPDVARAQNNRNCAWPIEFSPEGIANFVLPEIFARYCVIPFDTQYETMTIKGTYPNVRYFSFVVYDTGRMTPSAIAGDLYDAQIIPDPGSVNPFVPPETRPSPTGQWDIYCRNLAQRSADFREYNCGFLTTLFG